MSRKSKRRRDRLARRSTFNLGTPNPQSADDGGTIFAQAAPTTPNPGRRSIRAVATAFSFSGPLPPPEILAGYNDILPNGADRIVHMAEVQQQHRHSLEKTVVEGNVRSEKRGQWMGLFICLVIIASGTYLGAIGHQILGGSLVIGDLATLAGIFVLGKKWQANELTEKAEQFGKRKK